MVKLLRKMTGFIDIDGDLCLMVIAQKTVVVKNWS